MQADYRESWTVIGLYLNKDESRSPKGSWAKHVEWIPTPEDRFFPPGMAKRKAIAAKVAEGYAEDELCSIAAIPGRQEVY